MNWQEVKTNWNTVKTQVHAKWNKLTDSDLKAIEGKKDELVTRIGRRYSMEKQKIEKEVNDFVQNLH